MSAMAPEDQYCSSIRKAAAKMFEGENEDASHASLLSPAQTALGFRGLVNGQLA